MNRVELPEVTLICVDCVHYGSAISALQKSLEQIKPAHTLFLTDRKFDIDPQIEIIEIPRINSKLEYSKFMVKELGRYFSTSHCLVVQHDGYVLDGKAWKPEFLEVDFVGAPWLYIDERNVGNGGFSLRSLALCEFLMDDHIQCHNNEDDVICREYRGYLESKGIIFASEELADQFAYELREPICSTFGFHGGFHKPFKPTVLLKRSAALGDIVTMEPIISYLTLKNFNVVLDIPLSFFEIFIHHPSSVKHISKHDKRVPFAAVVDLDMAYEVNPRQLHLKSYKDVVFGDAVKDSDVICRPQLYPPVTPDKKLFDKYAVVHIDKRETTHRNVYGVNWMIVSRFLRSMGYTVIQVGANESDDAGGLKINTPSTGFLKWVIGGADLFIGVDSGPSHLAVAQNIKSVIMFGSVTPEYIHPDMTDIVALQSSCPAGKPGCWHEKPGTEGSICIVAPDMPPCGIINEQDIIEGVKKLLK